MRRVGCATVPVSRLVSHASGRPQYCANPIVGLRRSGAALALALADDQPGGGPSRVNPQSLLTLGPAGPQRDLFSHRQLSAVRSYESTVYRSSPSGLPRRAADGGTMRCCAARGRQQILGGYYQPPVWLRDAHAGLSARDRDPQERVPTASAVKSRLPDGAQADPRGRLIAMPQRDPLCVCRKSASKTATSPQSALGYI